MTSIELHTRLSTAQYALQSARDIARATPGAEIIAKDLDEALGLVMAILVNPARASVTQTERLDG